MTTLTLRLNGTPTLVRLGENTTVAMAKADEATAMAAAAALSSATAEAASGPNYADTTAGLAATVDGEAFAVDNGDGTVTVYLNSAGSAVAQRTLATTDALASTDSGKGAALVGFKASGATTADSTIETEIRRTVWLEQHFIAADADYYNAFTRALAVLDAAGGGELRIGEGTFSLSSTTLATPIHVPSFVKIRGAGINVTNIEVTGTAISTSIFDFHDERDVSFSDMTLRGNSKADAEANGSAIRGHLTASATTNMRNFHFDRLRLENFAGTGWIFLETVSAASGFTMGWIFSSDVEAYSESGNIPAGWEGDTGKEQSVFFISGFAAQITTVRIDNLYADAEYIKKGFAAKGNVRDIALDAPKVENAGRTSALDDGGSYALMFYDAAGGGMTDVVVRSPRISNPRSCGIYCAAAKNVTIIDPLITGQTDQQAGTLPKGAIAANAPGDGFKIIGGRLSGNWRDIHFVGGATGFETADVEVHGTTIHNTNTATTQSVRIEGSGVASVPAAISGFRFYGINFSTTKGIGIAVSTIANQRIDGFGVYAGSRIVGETYGIDLWAGMYGGSGTEHASDDYEIHDSYVRATGATGVPIHQRWQSGSLSVKRCKLRGIVAGTPGALFLLGCLDIDVADVVVLGADSAFRLDSSTGRTSGLRGKSITTALAIAGSLGLVKPTHSGTLGDLVQNLAPAAGEPLYWMCTGTMNWTGTSPIQTADAYTPTNVTTDRAFDADTVAVAELADVVGTLIADLKAAGVIS